MLPSRFGVIAFIVLLRLAFPFLRLRSAPGFGGVVERSAGFVEAALLWPVNASPSIAGVPSMLGSI